MANELDEMTGPVNEAGRDVNVIEKQLPVKVGVGSTIFQVVLCLFIIPIPFVLLARVNAGKKLSQLQQKIQQAASQVDNYMEQRVVILQNAAKLVEKGIDLDKSTFTEIAKLRAGGAESFTEQNKAIEEVSRKINVAFENYPDLKAHQELADAMQQNSYTQREIFARSSSGIGRSARQSSASGQTPISRSFWTLCCVGFVFSSPAEAM